MLNFQVYANTFAIESNVTRDSLFLTLKLKLTTLQ